MFAQPETPCPPLQLGMILWGHSCRCAVTRSSEYNFGLTFAKKTTCLALLAISFMDVSVTICNHGDEEDILGEGGTIRQKESGSWMTSSNRVPCQSWPNYYVRGKNASLFSFLYFHFHCFLGSQLQRVSLYSNTKIDTWKWWTSNKVLKRIALLKWSDHFQQGTGSFRLGN